MRALNSSTLNAPAPIAPMIAPMQRPSQPSGYAAASGVGSTGPKPFAPPTSCGPLCTLIPGPAKADLEAAPDHVDLGVERHARALPLLVVLRRRPPFHQCHDTRAVRPADERARHDAGGVRAQHPVRRRSDLVI